MFKSCNCSNDFHHRRRTYHFVGTMLEKHLVVGEVIHSNRDITRTEHLVIKEIIQTICQLILSTQMQKRDKHQEEEQ